MPRPPVSLSRLQILACALGALAGLVPALSFTAPLQGLYLAQATLAGQADGTLRVTQVEPGSPAERSGFRAGDELLDAGSFHAAQAALRAMRAGERRTFQVRNGTESRSIEAVAVKPELAAVWYGNLWYPIAGGVFLALGLWALATAPLVPPPLWRAVPLALAGFGLAVGFAVSWLTDSPFGRLRIWQRFAMGNGAEWQFGQGLVGAGAGLFLAVFAALDIRRRLRHRPD